MNADNKCNQPKSLGTTSRLCFAALRCGLLELGAQIVTMLYSLTVVRVIHCFGPERHRASRDTFPSSHGDAPVMVLFSRNLR